MNKRQTKKHLKKQIAKLQLDNDLMRRIIANDPEMRAIYDAFTEPLNITYTTLSFQEYHSKRFLPPDRPYDAGFIALFKQGHAKYCPECGYEMSEPPTEEVIRDKDYDWIIKRR